jgi:uncharacterized protein YgbK (DUF1537 family)
LVYPVRNQRDVLDEGATKRDVQHLDAAAHAQDGEAPVEHALDELELEGVAVRIGDRQELMRLLAVAARLDVPAAAEKDAVAGVEGIAEILPVQLREHERDATCERDRALVAHAGVVPEVL